MWLALKAHATVPAVKVFISWSGEAEQKVAEALRDAITTACAGRAQPFVSSQDIPKGERGVPFIDAQLASNDYGIVVLSAANHSKPWINYEGGAMASTLKNPVATVLLDLSLADFDGPLRPRQATKFNDREDMRDLFVQIATAADPGMPASATEILFESVWPAIQASWTPDANAPHKPLRTSVDMLAEVVDRVRNIEALQRRYSRPPARLREANRRVHLGPADDTALSDHVVFEIANTIEEVAAGKIHLISVGSTDSDSIRVVLTATENDQSAYGAILQHRISRLFPDILWRFSWELLLPEVEEQIDTGTDGPNG